MSCKFLEISTGKNLLPKKFEMVEVEKNTFMLKTKNSHFELLGTLDNWVKSNNLMEEPSYSDVLCKRSSSIRQVLSEVDDAIGRIIVAPRLNLESMIEKADESDNLFIGGDILMQWSVSQEKVIKDYGGIMAGGI
jgi:hypothetical protein